MVYACVNMYTCVWVSKHVCACVCIYACARACAGVSLTGPSAASQKGSLADSGAPPWLDQLDPPFSRLNAGPRAGEQALSEPLPHSLAQ